MTTSWSHFVRGQVPAAWRANAGGTVLALLAVLSLPWLLASGAGGRWLWRPPGEWTALVACLLIVLITLMDWAARYLMATWS